MGQAIAHTTKPKSKGNGKTKVPVSLIYEMWDGRPVYYKGWKEVLKHTKTHEEIMACSSLQAEIISFMLRIAFVVFNHKEYRVYSNEIGAHLERGKNRGLDIAIFDKKVLTSEKVTRHFADVPPQVVVEVDIKADLEDLQISETEYITIKTRQLLEFGTEKIFWIITASSTVIVAEQGKDWLMLDWNRDIELANGVFFNIGKHLEEEGIVINK